MSRRRPAACSSPNSSLRTREVSQDEDLDAPDWIELYNGTGVPVNLDGWFLTDDPADLQKWRFPATVIGAGEFLVVFASEKDREVAGRELHTNFKLSVTGEFLALVRTGSDRRLCVHAALPPADGERLVRAGPPTHRSGTARERRVHRAHPLSFRSPPPAP